MSRRDLALVVGILGGAGLYLAAIGPYWNITPDSATYVGNARSLAEGRGFQQVVANPPLTSLVLAPVAAIAPDRYGPLNAVSTILLLLALGLAYRLLEPRAGRTHALLVVLLSLGFVRFFHASTFLLSEPVYAFGSFLALVLIERQSDGRPWRQFAAGGAMVLVALTRTVGLTLIAAVLIHESVALLGRRRKARPLLAGGALLALLAWGGWKAWVAGQGAIAWETGYPSLDSATPLQSLVRAGSAAVVVGGVLANAWDPARGSWALALHAAASLVFLAGLARSLRRRPGIADLYLLFYLAVVLGHVVVGGYEPFRHLVPVVPLIFHHALVGARILYRPLADGFGRGVGRGLQAAGALGVAGFLAIGTTRIVERLPDEHRSPFGAYPIKRSGGYDAQRLALWLGDHAPPGARFAALQPDMWEVVSGRDGVDLAGASADPAAFLGWLERERVGYLLLDRALPFAERTAGPAIAAHPGRFRVLVRLPAATLYRVVVSGPAATAPGSMPARR